MKPHTVEVTARRWTHGWELYFGDDDVTQVRSLAHAGDQVRDYLDTLEPGIDHSDLEIRLVIAEEAEAIE